MNAHYHAGREAFLDNVHRWLMFGVIAFGAAALVDIFPDAERTSIKPALSAIAAMLGALDLTFDLSNRARNHSMMRRRYFDLIADVREGIKTTAQAKVCLDRYSGDESPPYIALLFACWNQAQKSVYGFDAKQAEIKWYVRLTKNLFRWASLSMNIVETRAAVTPPPAASSPSNSGS